MESATEVVFHLPDLFCFDLDLDIMERVSVIACTGIFSPLRKAFVLESGDHCIMVLIICSV